MARSWIAFVMLLAALPAGAQEDRAELLQRSAHAKKLIVRISGDGLDGAGIVFATDGSHVYGATAKHVLVAPGKKIRTGLRASFKMWHQALPVEGHRFHPRQDLATFKVDVRPLGLSVHDLKLALALDQLGSTAKLDPGDAIYTIGHATGGAWIDSKDPGRFIEREAFADPPQRDTLKLEHFCPPGHSGGGVFDGNWRLIGMIFDNQEPFCRALGIETVLSQVHDWKYDIQLQRPAETDVAPVASKGITVAVIDFDNRSGERLPDVGAAACDLVTSFLFNMPKVTVVTRDRLQSILREQQLNPTQMSTAGKSRVGRLVDADALVTGSVSRYDVERRTVRYRNTSMLSDTYRMSINLQIIDIDSGVIKFSKDYDVERVTPYPDARSAPSRPLSRESELLRELLEHQAREGVQTALRQITSGLDRAGKLIAVAVRSKPEGADVTVSGIYYGKTPLDLDLSLGVHEVEMKLPGYAPWRHRVNVGPDSTIEAVLSPGR